MLKIGKVSAADEARGTVQVVLEDADDMVTSDLPLLAHDFDMPKPGELVACLFLDNAPERGICLGRYYCDQLPGLPGNVIRKRLDGDKVYCDYNRDTGTVTVHNPQGAVVVICQSVTIQGDFTVNGNIIASGSIMDGTGNSNHHVH